MAAAAAQYYFRCRIWWCHSLPKVNIYPQTKFNRHILIHGWDITTSGLKKNNRPPYWNSSSGFDFDHATVLGVSLCIRLPNVVQIGPSSAKICYIDFHDCGRCGAILLPVSDRGRRSFSDVTFYQQIKYRSYSSIHGWDITISGLENQRRHIGIILLFSISTISPRSACHSAPVSQMSSTSDRQRQKNDIMSIFNMADLGYLENRRPIMVSLKSPCKTSYRCQ